MSAIALDTAREPQFSTVRGFDRLVMRVSLYTLMWARRHAERSGVSRDEQLLRRAAREELQRSQHEAMLLVSRVR